MIGLTVLALGGLTAVVGGIVDDQTSRADADRVAADLDGAIRPQETTGVHRDSVTMSGGSLRVEPREFRLLDRSGVIDTLSIDALVFEHDDRRVAVVNGAIVRGRPGGAWLVREPTITSGPDVLVAGAVRFNGSGGIGVRGATSVPLRSTVSHDRRVLGEREFRVAIETRTPGPFERLAAERGWPTERRDFDGDGIASVVTTYPGDRAGYLVVHDMRLEVGDG